MAITVDRPRDLAAEDGQSFYSGNANQNWDGSSLITASDRIGAQLFPVLAGHYCHGYTGDTDLTAYRRLHNVMRSRGKTITWTAWARGITRNTKLILRDDTTAQEGGSASTWARISISLDVGSGAKYISYGFTRVSGGAGSEHYLDDGYLTGYDLAPARDTALAPLRASALAPLRPAALSSQRATLIGAG